MGVLLILIPILVIMMGALFVALNGGKGQSSAYYARTSSLCVAEAGMADALAELEADPLWNTGFTNKQMTQVRGSYNVRFNQGAGPFSPDESVNNTDGTHNDSWRGSGTVPPGCSLIVVIAKIGTTERRLEALVGPSNSTIELDTTMLTTGKIRMQGTVNVNGITALNDSTAVSADIHSNESTAATDLVQWLASGGTLNVDGKVTSSGSNPSAVSIASGGTVTGGTQYAQPKKAVPPINIPGQIAAKSSAPAPALVPLGQTVIPTGDFYVAGDLNLTGDLKLDGGNLYVQGKLTVNGSVSGTGQVFVGSSTSIHGDSEINGKNSIALFSKGNVELRGFDGTAYLATAVNGNPTLTKSLTDAQWALQEMANNTSSGWVGADANYLEQVSQVLGGSTGILVAPGGREEATMWTLRDHLTNNVAPGPSRDFLIKRLDKIGRIFSQNGVVLGQPDATAIANYNATGDTDGLWDAVNDGNLTALMPAVYNTIKSVDYNRLGAASFQGLVYTNGSFYCANEINVIGAIVVNNDGTSPTVTLDGNTVNPGDLFINSGCDVTFVKDFFDDGGMGGTASPPTVLVWMGR